jgi:hypothetical protein
VIVRKDLPLGHLASQVAHAAGEGSERHPDGVHVVVLAARDEAHLREVATRLAEAGVARTVIEETDDPYRGQVMSIGCELVSDRAPLRKVLSSLPLLR